MAGTFKSLHQQLKAAQELRQAIATAFEVPIETLGVEINAHSGMAGAGTKKTGYALPEMGPFKCSNCIHIDAGGDCCDHPEVIADPDVPNKEEDGKKVAIVHPDSCCNYFHPKDKGEEK